MECRRRVEQLESLSCDEREDEPSGPGRPRRLLEHEQPGGLLERREHRAGIDRPDRAQVEHLDVGAEPLDRVEGERHAGAVRDHGCIRAGACDPSLSDRHTGPCGGRMRSQAPVERLVLEEEHRIGIVDRSAEKAVGVADRGRTDDFEPRLPDEPSFR